MTLHHDQRGTEVTVTETYPQTGIPLRELNSLLRAATRMLDQSTATVRVTNDPGDGTLPGRTRLTITGSLDLRPGGTLRDPRDRPAPTSDQEAPGV